MDTRLPLTHLDLTGHPPYTAKITVKEALDIARNTPPHIHKIVNREFKNPTFCVLGCHGDTGGGSKKVMQKLNAKIAIHPELKPDFIIILGDNYYPDGISSPDHPRVAEQFYQVFADPELENIRDIPCIIILGNHDAGRDNLTHYTSLLPSPTLFGINPLRYREAELQQVAHTYLVNPDLFSEEEIDYQHLPKYCMPSNYHAWIIDDTQLFGLNSNTYAKDYLDMLKMACEDHIVDASKNQAAWLKQHYDNARVENRTVIFATHNPLMTVGKRAYSAHWDAHHYLSANEITQLLPILQLDPTDTDFLIKVKSIILKTPEEKPHTNHNANYNDILKTIIFQHQHMAPDAVCSAHDHSLYYYNNKATNPLEPICQIVSGGGGSRKLQDRAYFGEAEQLGGFIKELGFCLLTVESPRLLNIAFHTVSPQLDNEMGMPQLVFSSESAQPLQAPEKDILFSVLRHAVLNGCKAYTHFLHQQQITENKEGQFISSLSSYTNVSGWLSFLAKIPTHNMRDIERMHQLQTYFNRPIASNYVEALAFLTKKLQSMENKTTVPSLYQLIQDQVKLVGLLEDIHIEQFAVLRPTI